MNEKSFFKNLYQNKKGESDINRAIKNFLAVRIKRMKAEENNTFLKNIDAYFDDLPSDFKERLSIYFDNNLDQESSLGQELKEELKEIIKEKKNNVELADYEIIDNE